MNKLLSLVACLLFVGSAVAENKYIRVVGEGSTVEQAKENVEIACRKLLANSVMEYFEISITSQS